MNKWQMTLCETLTEKTETFTIEAATVEGAFDFLKFAEYLDDPNWQCVKIEKV